MWGISIKATSLRSRIVAPLLCLCFIMHVTISDVTLFLAMFSHGGKRQVQLPPHLFISLMCQLFRARSSIDLELYDDALSDAEQTIR